MYRKIYTTLCEWKDDDYRKPALLRGARQTGKTYVVTEFGKNEFSAFIYVNFERNPEYQEIFSSLVPSEIVERIGIYLGKNVQPGETLVFLDEIQECPQAIMSLRYFYEEIPGLHIIGAGSLLEFAFTAGNFSMPVGRIQYLFLHPLSFEEFLTALNQSNLGSYISNLDHIIDLPDGLHERLIDNLQKYFIIGGMPAVVNAYIETGDLQKCNQIQQSILDTYSDDFSKYSSFVKHKYLKMVFHALPRLIGQKFVYAEVDRTTKSRDLKEAVSMLEQAGVIHRVIASSGEGIPLSARRNESFYKVIFLDIGLLHRLSNLAGKEYLGVDLLSVFKGAIAEQFVGQEITANAPPILKNQLYYWIRKSRNSQAEIDYLLELNGQLVPIEVKSGPSGRLKSLWLFIMQYKTHLALKISQSKFQASNPIISLPLYGIAAIFKSNISKSYFK